MSAILRDAPAPVSGVRSELPRQLQYLSPTLQFLLAVFVWGEPRGRAHVVAFACIWTGLLIFALHSLRRGAAEPVTRG